MKTPRAKKVCYFFAIYKAEEGGYWGRFVDFPAAEQGETIDDILYQATDFLQGIIDEYDKLGLPISPPSDIETFRSKLDPEDGTPVCISPVLAYPPSPSVRIQITAKASQIAEIDRFARANAITRSEFLIQSALRAAKA
jgi:predicted RNase H-like HicB family nuclease